MNIYVSRVSSLVYTCQRIESKRKDLRIILEGPVQGNTTAVGLCVQQPWHIQMTAFHNYPLDYDKLEVILFFIKMVLKLLNLK